VSVDNDVRRVFNRIIKHVGDTVTNKKMKALGEFALELIVKRTRLGYGVRKNNAKRRRLRQLSPGYVKFRRDNRRDLDKTTTPKKSNLTLTGQMLRSMKVTRVRKASVLIAPTKRRGGKYGRGLTNAKVAEYQAKQGRPFNFLTDLEAKKVRRYYERTLRKSLK